MKIEPRGKYSGIKLHLEGDEVVALINHYKDKYVPLDEHAKGIDFASTFGVRVAVATRKLMVTVPSILEDKTPEQVAEVLHEEANKATNKLLALKAGKDWTKVKG